ncbi:hypothetical protein LBMAG14_09380 [Actinomycetes bacterium]|nr:hypothetical protein LBMAG14_09380 [Actinomycetes bacterium]
MITTTVKAKNNAIGDAIRAAYRGRLTQTELAKKLGVAQNTVSRWSTGDASPSFDDLAALERACNLPLGWVLRAAGYVTETKTAADAIAADPNIDSPRRELLLATYRAAVAQSAKTSSAVAASNSSKRRKRAS